MIVRSVEPPDVIRSIAFAHDRAVAVRSGKHDLIWDGIVIDLSRMKEISLERELRSDPSSLRGECKNCRVGFSWLVVSTLADAT